VIVDEADSEAATEEDAADSAEAAAVASSQTMAHQHKSLVCRTLYTR